MIKNDIDLELKKKYAVLALKWCVKNFGVCERKRTKLKLEISDRKRTMKKSNVFGVYCFYKIKITIYGPNCKSLFEIVSTVIHEYTHYLQSRTMYSKYEKTHQYHHNPLEKEAKRNEKLYAKECYRNIKKLID